MGLVLFNCFLYLSSLSVYLFNTKRFDGGFIILFVYFIISLFGVALYMDNPSEWNLRLWPFIYLYIICMLYFRQFFFNGYNLFDRLRTPNIKILTVFSFLYAFCSVVSIYYGYTSALENIVNDALRDAYVDNSMGHIELYGNQFERLCKIFAQYFQPIALITVFYLLTRKRVNTLRITLLALSVLLPTLISSIIIGNRSMIVHFLILVLICFSIFQRGISKKRKFIIFFPAVFFSMMIFWLLSSISISRFGDTGASSSNFYYLGHSMLTFNCGLTDTIHTYTNGKFFFSWFVDLFGGDSTINVYRLGLKIEGAFTTFVGAMYLDFGPIVTFFIALFLPFCLSSFFKRKKVIGIANIYMYAFSLNHFTYGVFTVAYGSAIIWIMAIIIFFVLKITDDINW